MGVYLSAPVTEKVSTNEECPKQGFCFGTSSMQGWRIAQEDAHNSIPVFHEKSRTSFFAVYDGHGGSEVAKYCELHFPDFVKQLMEERTEWETNPVQFIQSAFLAFDATITSDDVIKELKMLSGKEDDIDEDDEDGPVGRAETDLLKEEAEMPLEELLAQYKKTVTENGATSASSTSEDTKPADSNNCASSAADSTTSGASGAGGSSSAGGSGSGSSSKPSNGERSSKVKAAADMAKVTSTPDSDSDEDEDDENANNDDMWEDDSDDDDDEEDEEEDDNNVPMMDTSDEEPGSDSGCTACVLLKQGSQLLVANAGDSRCVLARAGKAVDLSYDHKPEDEPERKRIEKAGGKVTADGRVNGGLNLSRAIGDHVYKRNTEVPAREQMISALPDVMTKELTPDDQFLVLACDGIWNSMTSQEVVDFVTEKLKDPKKRKQPAIICEELFDACLAPNTHGDGTGCDNMTCIIIVLDESSSNERQQSSEEVNTAETKDANPSVKDKSPSKEPQDANGDEKEKKVESEANGGDSKQDKSNTVSDSSCLQAGSGQTSTVEEVSSAKQVGEDSSTKQEDQDSRPTPKRCADGVSSSEEKRRKVEGDVA